MTLNYQFHVVKQGKVSSVPQRKTHHDMGVHGMQELALLAWSEVVSDEGRTAAEILEKAFGCGLVYKVGTSELHIYSPEAQS